MRIYLYIHMYIHVYIYIVYVYVYISRYSMIMPSRDKVDHNLRLCISTCSQSWNIWQSCMAQRWFSSCFKTRCRTKLKSPRPRFDKLPGCVCVELLTLYRCDKLRPWSVCFMMSVLIVCDMYQKFILTVSVSFWLSSGVLHHSGRSLKSDFCGLSLAPNLCATVTVTSSCEG